MESSAATSSSAGEGVGANHAGLAEDGVDGGVRAGQGGGVRARRLSGRRCERPLFIARTGFSRASRRAMRGELARVAERLEVEQDEVGAGVVLPPLEQVVGRDVGLVADRDERREAEAASLGAFEEGEPESAATWEEKPIRPAGKARGCERGVEADRGGGDAETIRADETSAVGPDGGSSSLPAVSTPSGPVSAKPAEMTQSARVPVRALPPRHR